MAASASGKLSKCDKVVTECCVCEKEMIATTCGGRWEKWKAETISMRDHPCIAIGQSMSESEAAKGQSLSVHLLAGQLEPPKTLGLDT